MAVKLYAMAHDLTDRVPACQRGGLRWCAVEWELGIIGSDEMKMSSINVEISDGERKQAEARAAELGFARLEDYVAALVRNDVELPLSDELEAELLRSLQTPAREISPADWDEKRRRMLERHGQAKAG
jgi:hypothetical protein